MKKIYLVVYVDNTDNTRGVVCASETESINGKAADAVKGWLGSFETFTENEIKGAINQLHNKEVAYIGDYEIWTEETFLYS